MGVFSKLRGWFGSSESEEPADPRELFTAEVERLLAEIPGIASWARRSDFALDVTLATGAEHVFFLENTFLESRDSSPEERDERLRALLSAGIQSEGDLDWDEARELVVPLLRAVTLFAGVDCNSQSFTRRPFAPFLIEAIVVDREHAIEYVSEETAQRWAVDVDALFRIAHANAAEYFSESDVEQYDADAAYVLWRVTADDTYEASRLLLGGWLVSFSGKVDGKPVAIVPERSTLIVGGDGNAECLQRLIEMAEREYAASPRNISPALYTVDDDGKVIPLVLPASHHLANDVARGHLRLALAEYEAQKENLEAEVEDTLFVASCMGFRKDDGSVSSVSTWTKELEVSTLLPKTDDIALVYGDLKSPRVLTLPWAVVVQLAPGSLTQEPDMDPPRWRTGAWPDSKTMKRLREAVSSGVDSK